MEEAVRTMAGESGVSTGEEIEEMVVRDEGLEVNNGRRGAGRAISTSGVDTVEARFELGCVADNIVDVLSGQGMAVSTGCGVEMGRSSGISSSSCLGLRIASLGGGSYEMAAEEASNGSSAGGCCP